MEEDIEATRARLFRYICLQTPVSPEELIVSKDKWKNELNVFSPNERVEELLPLQFNNIPVFFYCVHKVKQQHEDQVNQD